MRLDAAGVPPPSMTSSVWLVSTGGWEERTVHLCMSTLTEVPAVMLIRRAGVLLFGTRESSKVFVVPWSPIAYKMIMWEQRMSPTTLGSSVRSCVPFVVILSCNIGRSIWSCIMTPSTRLRCLEVFGRFAEIFLWQGMLKSSVLRSLRFALCTGAGSRDMLATKAMSWQIPCRLRVVKASGSLCPGLAALRVHFFLHTCVYDSA